MTKYRIKEVHYENGRTVYMIQKKKRFFLIGPKVWKYYRVLLGVQNSHYELWTIFRRLGDYFYSKEHAKETLHRIMETNWGNVTKDIVVGEFETEK